MSDSKIRSDNFIVLQGWMVTDLKLKGNELLVYAIIYGFSQNVDSQRYTGSLQYLADWTNSTKQGVIKNLKSLVDKGFIVKDEKVINGVKFCEYYSTKFNRVLNSVERGIKQSLTGGIKQSLPNNIAIDNIEDNLLDNIDNTSDSKKPVKHKYGEYKHVLLTDEELEKLYKEYGVRMADDAVTFLDEYIEMKGYKAKSHYLAIRKWVINAVNENKQKRGNEVKVGGKTTKHNTFGNIGTVL